MDRAALEKILSQVEQAQEGFDRYVGSKKMADAIKEARQALGEG